MTIKKNLAACAVVFMITFFISATGVPARALASAGLQFLTPTPAKPGEVPPEEMLAPQGQAQDQAIQAALQAAVGQNREALLGFVIYEVFVDHIDYSQDGSTALVWMALRDTQTGEIVASEPGLSIARLEKQGVLSDPSSWTIELPFDADFVNQLRALPAELQTEDVIDRFLTPAPTDLVQPALAFSGYKLPWTAGLAKRVTNSIGHVYSVSGGLTSCPNTCRYAFDFADGTMFPMIAAKGGTIKAYKYTCPNYDSSCTNYLVLEDQSTIPTSYQLYYHMAYNTIPERLRTVGAAVRRGEYIGDADDTGASTGHHLHFHVYQTATGSNWSWGPSVDFTFDDVPVNGGRPRTCAEASEYPDLGSQCFPSNYYTSGNTPANPPSGTLDLPVNHQIVTSRTVRVQGLASDDIQIVRIQVLVDYDGSWKAIDDITPNGNGPYAKDVDLCSAGVPDGPFKLTVRIYDREGSQVAGLPVQQMIKAFTCGGIEPPSPPACTPTENQVALYADTDFRGACQKFNVNNNAGYPASALTTLGDNNAASIQVGSGVRAVLFDRTGDVSSSTIAGRIETVDATDASLIDNRIGVDRVSGLWVVSRSVGPDETFIRPVGNRMAESPVPSSVDSLVLAWEGGLAASSYEISLAGPGASWTKTVSAKSVSVGNLPAGSYTFTVKSRNNNTATNTTSKTFTISQAALPGTSTLTVPYTDDMQSGAVSWVATGLWRLGSVNVGGRGATQAWIFNDGTDYSDATWRAGDLTSPPVAIPASGTHYLRFSYYMDTESGYPYWDQRLVQVSVNGGAFTDLYQFSDDKQSVGPVWLKSGPLSLSAFAGQTIRLRFHFDTIDTDNNTGLGWIIDDVSIDSTAPDNSCADNNDTPDTAQSISIGESVSGVICPERDVDYYKLVSVAGMPVVIDIDAKKNLVPASILDSVVTLLDGDKRSPIAENDDEEYAVLVDSLLPYSFQRDGTYYIKVKPWSFPGTGGAAYTYRMTLSESVPVPPTDVRILFPTASNRVPAMPFRIYAAATDFDGGMVSDVVFYWHGPDWSKDWVKLGADSDGSDGWSFDIDPAAYGGVNGSALFVQGNSRTGGVKGTVLWDLQADQVTPFTRLDPLPGEIGSNVFQLNWRAIDPQNDIDHFDLQYQEITSNGTGAWKNWQDPYHANPIPGYARSAWFSGTAGYGYNIRLRAVDQAGNVEPWIDVPGATTRLSAACVPDEYEIEGQNRSNAIYLARSDFSPSYNLCSYSAPGADDADWFAVDAGAGEDLLVWSFSNGGGSAFILNLYNASGSLLLSRKSPDYETVVTARWAVPESSRYYLELRPLHPEMAGTDMRYQVWYGPGNWLYLPIVGR
jgi:hypothetical protein